MSKQADNTEWQTALAQLRVKEKAVTEQLDALAAERRRLPKLPITKNYTFESSAGTCDLGDLFHNQNQLIVYHHMLKKDDPSPCTGCAMVGDQIPHLAHLYARDTSLVFVSTAPSAQIDLFKTRMGWNIPWYSCEEPFNTDHDVGDGFGINVFYRHGDTIFRTYFTNGRGVESLGTVWSLLDLTPMGRQELWEDAPADIQQSEPYQWWRLNDEYD